MYKLLVLIFCLVISAMGRAQHVPGVYHDPSFGSLSPSSDPTNVSNRASSGFASRGIDGDAYDMSTPGRSQHRNIKTEVVLTFSHVFNDALVDSFWVEYRSHSDYQLSGNIIRADSLTRKYLHLLKVICGDSFQFSEEQKSLVRDTLTRKETAQVLYKCFSDRAKGYLSVKFDIESKHQIVLDKINFYPFDHAPNAFLSNLCEKDLNLIKTEQISMLLDSISRYANAESESRMKGAKKKFEKAKLQPGGLFTYRVFVEKNDIWVVGVFDTDKADTHLLLGYKLIDKKFKPALVEVIKKDG